MTSAASPRSFAERVFRLERISGRMRRKVSTATGSSALPPLCNQRRRRFERSGFGTDDPRSGVEVVNKTEDSSTQWNLAACRPRDTRARPIAHDGRARAARPGKGTDPPMMSAPICGCIRTSEIVRGQRTGLGEDVLGHTKLAMS